MPELPEVETVCRQLAPALNGRKLLSIIQHDPKIAFPAAAELKGSRVRSVFRSGKQIIIDLQHKQESCYIVVHLRMTGRLLWRPARSAELMPGNFTHKNSTSTLSRLDFNFKGGILSFCDVRRFGTVKLCRCDDDFKPKGLDPVLDDVALPDFIQILHQSKQPLKHLLMRQDRFVGIGNIYASEILFDARLSPFRSASTLSSAEQKSLFRSIRKILLRAIERSGTTFSDFQDSEGNSGTFQNLLKVYEREGCPCRRCKVSLVERKAQQQRSTYYCPTCQL